MLVGGKVRTHNKSDSQIGVLDPEKIYFVEKFGYLIKKINGGYGGPVQEALFARINKAVQNFKTDLPNIVHDLEVSRLKSISIQNKAKIELRDIKSDIMPKIYSKSEEITKRISEKITNIQKSVSEKEITDAKIKSERLHKIQTQASELKKQFPKESTITEEIEIDIDIPNKKSLSRESGQSEPVSSSILRPSIAIIREEQRLEQLKAIQGKRESSVIEPARNKPADKPSRMSVPPELTEWERKWHKYDSDIIGEEFNGYS